eukprot:TRINITY_DN17113_c0_g2_i3.p1 TRINITY_DN17113_c0_g2~~TRINITY_DN17113_c0_g2_i3.p1  ORF type:complete len:361 (+),score=97.96 TRINITY_DN17113_c0_g2_i3:98-1084(+)
MLRSLVGSEMCIRDRGDMDALRLVLTLLSFYTAATTPTTYRAAAVEFAPERAPNASISISQARALQLRNLERFVPFIAAAKANHSHIIVFPEYGITGDGTTLEDADFSRDLATIFAEGIPSPDASTSLCGQTAHSKDYPVTRALACMAQKFEIVLAANMLDVVPCTVGRAGCSDGRHQYNTAVVFDQTGALAAKYYKKHLYGKESQALDPGPDNQTTVFESSFGVRFGILICFDLVFELEPPREIRHWLFPTDWVNFAPHLRGERSVDAQRIWSFLHQKSLIASNYGGFGREASGSGIWDRGEALADFYNPSTHPESKLLIADVKIDP